MSSFCQAERFAPKALSDIRRVAYVLSALIRYRKFIQNVLALPLEIQILILRDVEISDLLSLRLSSRNLHYLVESCSSALVRWYIRTKLSRLETNLYPVPPPHQATFRYLLDIEHRIKISRGLATILSDFYAWNVFRYNRKRKRTRTPELDRLWRDIFCAMAPLIFTLNHFFESYRQMILERAMTNWRPKDCFQIFTGGPTVWDDQVSILMQYQPELMLDCYHVYGFALQVLDWQLHPTRFEKAMRNLQGLKATICATPDIEILLMLGGMQKLYHVLKQRTYGRRRDALDHFISSIKPSQNPEWKPEWEKLNVASSKIQLVKVPNLKLRLPALHLVWVPSALKLLLGSNTILGIDFNPGNGPRPASDFVTDLITGNVTRTFGGRALGVDYNDSNDEDGEEEEIDDSDESATDDDSDDHDG
jgi:hypothetical protein